MDKTLIERVNTLLPKKPIDWLGKPYSYECEDAAFYVLGITSDKSSRTDDGHIIPLPIHGFSEIYLRREGFVRVPSLNGHHPTLVTLSRNITMEQMVHAAVLLGTTPDNSWVFHKPGYTLPEVNTLERVHERYSKSNIELKTTYWTVHTHKA